MNRSGPLLLRQERHLRGQVSDRPTGPGQDAEQLERREHAVAGVRVLANDDVAALLAAQACAADEHPLEDVLVADRGPNDLATRPFHDLLEAAVG